MKNKLITASAILAAATCHVMPMAFLLPLATTANPSEAMVAICACGLMFSCLILGWMHGKLTAPQRARRRA